MGVGIMLQQTQAETVIPYYRRFMQALPDIKSLAACTEDS
jgi:A/G-specific adenine glycosylase